jgi:hypothetical protein
LPVSGALQLNTCDAMGLRPMISDSGAYSRLVSPGLWQEQIPQTGSTGALFEVFDEVGMMMGIARCLDLCRHFGFGGIDVFLHESRDFRLQFAHFWCR